MAGFWKRDSSFGFHASTTTTQGNSSPLAACTDMIVTASLSLSTRRLTNSPFSSFAASSVNRSSITRAWPPAPPLASWSSSTTWAKSTIRRSPPMPVASLPAMAVSVMMSAASAAIPLRCRVACKLAICSWIACSVDSPRVPTSARLLPKNAVAAARLVRPRSLGRSIASSMIRTSSAIWPCITLAVPLLTAGMRSATSCFSISLPTALTRTKTQISPGLIARGFVGSNRLSVTSSWTLRTAADGIGVSPTLRNSTGRRPTMRRPSRPFAGSTCW